ncbi:hypothetical protein DAETH_40860 (plasmid) [Deinococcus aetherius]|uniref:Uncharacterized protein n=2 Tax=Deinococcus aetherius TaxID=200252 RepID=A0ABM8AK72_9DEIO|nr:hypothetical protein DAETH_40860 [Deinococcus aetherius]
MSLLISEVFARAWTLADDLNDAGAQDQLAELRRQSLALPLFRQDHILNEVAALTERLRRQQQARPPSEGMVRRSQPPSQLSTRTSRSSCPSGFST